MMRMLLIASLATLSACTAAASPPALAGAEPQIAAPAAQIAASEALPAAIEPQPVVAASYAERALPDVRCDVRAIRTSHGVRLEAVAMSDDGAFGEYEFVITKRDRGGSSDITQGGEYDLSNGASQSLGSAEVSLERGGGYEARLVLRDDDGVACAAETSR
ncbi:MAG TPA: curli-like amyloid fiber formation chaperone CsgH [Vitreimonas sp.]|jgi:hypothetical protein|nr:curli-like amyloid fiber formation chaperone CsgH [Vitreimonas sp.]